MNKASLKKYVEKRLSESPYKSRAKSLGEYIGERTAGEKYKDAVSDAVLGTLSSSLGLMKESALARSNNASGYSHRLAEVLRSRTAESLEKLEKDRESRDISLLHGYLDYVKRLEDSQYTLAKNAEKKLYETKLYSRESLRSYALGMGLGESDAEAVSNSVYGEKLGTLESEILSAVESLAITPLDAEGEARKYGLDESDVAIIKEKAEKIYKAQAPAPDETLGELTDKAEKKGPLARLIEKLKGNKKGNS